MLLPLLTHQMKRIIFILVFIQAFSMSNAHAQNFFPLPPGFSSEVRTLFYDSSSNTLYAGGNFYSLAWGPPMNGISRWNGTAWDSMGSGLFGNVYSIVKYNGFIYAGGTFAIKDSAGNFIYPANISYWDGAYWRLPPGGVSANLTVWSLFVNGNDLYVGGLFDSIAGMHARGVARYDGIQWHSYPALNLPYYPDVFDVIIYNNELYAGGAFNNGLGLEGIAKFDGTNWVTVGGGLSNSNSFVQRMMVYQGELYIVGDFHVASGGPGNCVSKWNGTTWSSLGSGTGTGGQLFSIAAFNNQIYVGGNFFTIGGISSPYIAKWDGANWNSLGSTFSNGTDCFASHGNDLYIGGGFTMIDSDTMYFITRYTPPLGVEVNGSTTNFSVFPNPVTNNLTITTHTNTLSEIILYDITSRKLLHQQFTNTVTLNTSQLSKGIYIYEVTNNKGVIGKGKVVKE
jgi:hypothetical protein